MAILDVVESLHPNIIDKHFHIKTYEYNFKATQTSHKYVKLAIASKGAIKHHKGKNGKKK